VDNKCADCGQKRRRTHENNHPRQPARC
jgi:hypothetical protein